MKNIELEITGTTPLIMNSARSLQRLDPLVRQKATLTGKRKKTDEDYQAIMDIEMRLTAYWYKDSGLYLPAANVSKAFLEACKKQKLGRQAIGFMVQPDFHGIGFALRTRNSTSEKFFEDPANQFISAVKQRGEGIVKCRALAPSGWKVTIKALLNTDLLDVDTVEAIWNDCGILVGFGDWRPSAPRSPGSYGCFEVTSFKAS